jgi:hypothetical protein
MSLCNDSFIPSLLLAGLLASGCVPEPQEAVPVVTTPEVARPVEPAQPEPLIAPAPRPELDLSLPEDVELPVAGDSAAYKFDAKPLFTPQDPGNVDVMVTPGFSFEEEGDELPQFDGGQVDVTVKTP